MREFYSIVNILVIKKNSGGFIDREKIELKKRL